MPRFIPRRRPDPHSRVSSFVWWRAGALENENERLWPTRSIRGAIGTRIGRDPVILDFSRVRAYNWVVVVVVCGWWWLCARGGV